MTTQNTFGPRFNEALEYAATVHRTQKRKGTPVPYVGHLLGVASIVIDNGGNEDEAIAALLHNAPEDQGASYASTRFGGSSARTLRRSSKRAATL